MKNGAA